MTQRTRTVDETIIETIMNKMMPELTEKFNEGIERLEKKIDSMEENMNGIVSKLSRLEGLVENMKISLIDLEKTKDKNVIDAVFIPPDVDTLTDEENMDDENYSPENESTDIAGTFERHVPDSHNDVREDEQDGWSPSDEEDLASKRKRSAPMSSRICGQEVYPE
ncbi:hypothetical protein JTB14_010599 [Gonioctena quinquepunctata]|nr:hypothetical protein JTB14_010599 [Gonioctena quinquepunctata]